MANHPLQWLKEATSALHDQTEKLLYADEITEKRLTREAYIRLLTIHYSFYRALEEAVDHHEAAFTGYDLATRRKTPWLAADLRTAGASVPAVHRYFGNWSADQLAGACYVAEGATLGGQVIRRHLLATPELEGLVQQSRFWMGYGENTGLRWRTFCAWLAARALGREAEITLGASNAFRLFHRLSREATGSEPR